MLKAFALIGVELMVVTATALFFSTFSSPFLSVALSLAVYVIGHFSADLKNIGSIVDSAALSSLARAVYYVMPNLAPLDIKAAVVHGEAVGAMQMLLAAGSSALYIATLLVAATIVFSRRDLK
jgi:Cu-processing system permease protein